MAPISITKERFSMYKYFFLYTLKENKVTIFVCIKINLIRSKELLKSYKIHKALVEIKGDAYLNNSDKMEEIQKLLLKVDKINNLPNIHNSFKKYNCGDSSLYEYIQLSNIILNIDIKNKSQLEFYLETNKMDFIKNSFQTKKSFY